MKKYLIPLFSSLLLYYGCSNSDSRKELSEKEKQEIEIKHAKWELDDQKEKIVLLASIKNIPSDSLYDILMDYTIQAGGAYSFSTRFDSIPYEKITEAVARKHRTSKHRIASLIFSFKYEMRTPDEIIEKADEDRAQAEADERDGLDQY